MKLKQLIERFNNLSVDEERTISDEYVELVFFTKDTDQWNKVLTDILGPALKPKGQQPTEGDLKLTEDCGGVHDNQTLFKKEVEGALVIAMFWPWLDGMFTTLKIACLKK
ncbi:MAG: hypothetical protein NG712_05090 [Omnitrophica bacterium]|nr:hypothetical protein [Candidatus Omnitrophota bacterium]